MDELAQGLIDFYSGQANAMLAQYEDINRLLGETSDWTGPGTLCETLLRNFLRKHVLAGMSVDKGFVYGRVKDKEPKGHGPEIDILVHNTADFAPVFRMDDFVIVQPEAVIAMIQVKRTLATGEKNPLGKGIKNVARAKQHILEVRFQDLLRTAGPQMKQSQSTWQILEDQDIFTAVVGFKEIFTKPRKSYRTALLRQHRFSQSWQDKERAFDTTVATLPDFVGSLTGSCVLSLALTPQLRSYALFPAEHEKKNVALQLFLGAFARRVFAMKRKRPLFSIPDMPTRDKKPIVIPDPQATPNVL